MSTKLSQKDYLKKYSSATFQGKKRKKKSKNIKVVDDDDIDFTDKKANNNDELILTGEDAPQIVEIVDDCWPSELKTFEDFRKIGKWKGISKENSDPKKDRSENFISKASKDLDPKSIHVRRKYTGESSKDLSPIRKPEIEDIRNKQKKLKRQNFSHCPSSKSPTKTLGGKKSDFQDTNALKEESIKLRKQENRLLMKMLTEFNEKGLELATRSGKHRNHISKEEREKENLKMKQKEIYYRWGKGLKQIENHKNKLSVEKHEMSKPLGRYANDPDLEELLKKQYHDGDPMLQYIKMKNKKIKRLNCDEKLSVPIYEGSFPENRFNIRPGYRWDGVNRSNGFEKRWFKVQNKKKAIKDESYKKIIEDM